MPIKVFRLLLLFVPVLFFATCEEDDNNNNNNNSQSVCDGVTCSGHGDTVEVLSTCVCDCHPGYSGAQCQVADSCITQNLCGTNGTCDGNGGCDCNAGYEGDFCDVFSYQKYEGSYQVSESCTTTLGGTITQQFTSAINVGANIDDLTINNFSNRGLPVDATIVSANFLTITSQNVGSLQVSAGEGTFQVLTSNIQFEYGYTVGSNFHECTAIFTRL